MYYAGIGSRETPDHILKIMHHIGAYLWTQGWTLRSGHAVGADQAFETGVQTSLDACVAHAPERREIYLPWSGFNNAGSEDYFYSPKEYPFSAEEMEFTAKFHPNWKKCSPSARLLHQRNTRIMIGLEPIHGPEVMLSAFVVCWTLNGEAVGGTGQAIRIAKGLDIPIINLGHAQSADELEQLVLRIDEYQTKLGKSPSLGNVN